MSYGNIRKADIGDRSSAGEDERVLGPSCSSNLTKSRVVDIYTPVNSRGVILPIARIEPKIKLGENYQIGNLYFRSWDELNVYNVRKGGDIWYIVRDGTFSLVEANDNEKQIGKICCPICGSKDLVSTTVVKRCINPDCGYWDIKAIWVFLRVCLKIGNMPYMRVYNLYQKDRLKTVLDIWSLQDEDLEYMGLNELDKQKFKTRVENLKEITLEELIYVLSINGIKAAGAIDLARRIGNNVPYYKINDKELNEYLSSSTRSEFDKKEKITAKETALIWNKYLTTHDKMLKELSKKIKILPSDVRNKLAGRSFFIGNTGKYNKDIVSDLLRLQDGRIVSRVKNIYWPFISYLIVDKLDHRDKLQQEATFHKVPILTIDSLVSKGVINLPDSELTFNPSKDDEVTCDIYDDFLI